MRNKFSALGALFCVWLIMAHVVPTDGGETETLDTVILRVEGMT